MPECNWFTGLSERTTEDRNLTARLQRTTSAQFVELPAARRVCADRAGDEGMRKASTELLEQGTQPPSLAPDLIPLKPKINRGRTHWDWCSKRGTSQSTPVRSNRDA